jgi:hypothetical protein
LWTRRLSGAIILIHSYISYVPAISRLVAASGGGGVLLASLAAPVAIILCFVGVVIFYLTQNEFKYLR